MAFFWLLFTGDIGIKRPMIVKSASWVEDCRSENHPAAGKTGNQSARRVSATLLLL